MTLANNCWFKSTTSGTGTFSCGAAITGYSTPLLAGAVNGSSYSYRANDSANANWEIGIGEYATQIDPAFESTDNTKPNGDGFGEPVTLNAPPTFSNGDLLVAFLNIPVTAGQPPGTLGISGGGATWNIIGPVFQPAADAGDGADHYFYALWKQAASEPTSWTFSWNNADGGAWTVWQIAAFTTGGSTASIDTSFAQLVTSSAIAVPQQTTVGGIELRLMFQWNWGGEATNVQNSANFISIQPYTASSNQSVFGYALLNNTDNAPEIPIAFSYTGVSCGLVFEFSGAADTLSRDLVLLSSNFNQAVDFTANPQVLLSAAAHEISGQTQTVITTSSYTVQPTDVYLAYNGAFPTTWTLPAAAEWYGREINIQNTTVFAVASASSNVVPVGGGSAGTAILPGTDGTWLVLKSNGDNWLTIATNIGQYGTPLASAVFAWPEALPSNDETAIGQINDTGAGTNPLTASINIGGESGPTVIMLAYYGVSTDTLTVGGVSIPLAAEASGGQGIAFLGSATGLSGSQTFSYQRGDVFNAQGIGVWASQFQLEIAAIQETSSGSGSIVCAANSILLGVFQATRGGSAPSNMNFAGSTALPTSRVDTSFEDAFSSFNNYCCAIFDITTAGTFTIDFTSSPGNLSFICVNLVLGPASPSFRLLVDKDLPAGAPNAGNVVSPGANAISLGSTGPAGAGATPAGYLTFVDSTSTTRYVPYF